MRRLSQDCRRGRRLPTDRLGGWRRVEGRGVSDVVATILLLALTVTLFASIFAFVGAFPQPTPQAQNEFQSTLVLTTNGTYVSGLTITHLAGPVLSPYDHVLLSSSRVQSTWQFNIGGQGIPVSWGLGNTSNGWSLGQVWTTTFTKLVKVPDNITVYVVSPTQLLYSATLPALVQNIPPAIQTVGTTPSSPAVGQAFQIWATLAGNITGVTVKVNLGGIPGLSGTKTMTNVSYVWEYNNTAATSTAGTYYAFVTVSSPSGQTVSQSVPVVISSSGGGGGGSGAQLTVAVGLAPQPLSVPGMSLFPYATITYSGSSSNVNVWVNFTIVQSVGGKKVPLIVKTADPGPTGNKISGPSSITVYGTSSVSGWYLNGTDVVYGNASLPGVGTANGTAVLPVYNLATSIVYFTTSNTGAPPVTHSVSHRCSSLGTCPYLYLTVWDNFTTALYGGPSSISFSGTVYANSTTGGFTYSKAIASTAVNQGSSTSINVVGGSSTWIPPGGNSGTVYNVIAVLTVTGASGTIGYLIATFSLTLT